LVAVLEGMSPSAGAVQELVSAANEDNDVRAREESIAVVELVDGAVERVRHLLGERFVSRDLKSDLPLIAVDRAMTDDALAEVLKEVARVASDKSTILVRAYRQGGGVAIDVDADAAAGGVAAGAVAEPLSLTIARAFLNAEQATLSGEGARRRLFFPVRRL